MATCKDCFHYELCKCVGTNKLYPGKSDGCRFMTDSKKRVEQKPIKTNADRIRAMSDEELANLLTTGYGDFDCSVCKLGDQVICDIECKKHCVEWLQQPAEEAMP